MTDFIVAIPARHAASRLPGKPLRLLVQAVGSRIDTYFERAWAPGETRGTRLVVIGLHDMDEAAVRAAIAAAV